MVQKLSHNIMFYPPNRLLHKVSSSLFFVLENHLIYHMTGARFVLSPLHPPPQIHTLRRVIDQLLVMQVFVYVVSQLCR